MNSINLGYLATLKFRKTPHTNLACEDADFKKNWKCKPPSTPPPKHPPHPLYPQPSHATRDWSHPNHVPTTARSRDPEAGAYSHGKTGYFHLKTGIYTQLVKAARSLPKAHPNLAAKNRT